jgi:hypothetical protein
MGWFGEVTEGLDTAAKRIDASPRGTLGWFVAASQWNDWAWEAVTDGNKWEDTGLPADQLPKNCEWCPREDNDPPLVLIPNYDPEQVLREKHG